MLSFFIAKVILRLGRIVLSHFRGGRQAANRSGDALEHSMVLPQHIFVLNATFPVAEFCGAYDNQDMGS